MPLERDVLSVVCLPIPPHGFVNQRPVRESNRAPIGMDANWSPRLRAWNPAYKRTGHVQCAGQESNLQSSKAGGLQPLRLANAQPTHVEVARVGVEPTIREGLSFAALPVCVPRYKSVPDRI